MITALFYTGYSDFKLSSFLSLVSIEHPPRPPFCFCITGTLLKRLNCFNSQETYCQKLANQKFAFASERRMEANGVLVAGVPSTLSSIPLAPLPLPRLRRPRSLVCFYQGAYVSFRPGARFSKVPKTFRARKAICETVNRFVNTFVLGPS